MLGSVSDPGDPRDPVRLVEIVARRGVPRLLDDETIEAIAVAALQSAGAPSPGVVTIILADDAELTALNERAMGIAEPTDVLSFPLLPASAFPPHPGQAAEGRAGVSGPAGQPPFALPPGEPTHLGEVVISVERAIEQAEDGRGGQTGDRQWDAIQELRLLVTHGVLHLCGWDHAEPVEESAMRALERELLEA